MKEGDKLILLHHEFPKCGCSSEFNKLEIGKEYLVSTIGTFTYNDKARELGNIPTVSLKNAKWGGYFPLSLFQPMPVKELNYQIY